MTDSEKFYRLIATSSTMLLTASSSSAALCLSSMSLGSRLGTLKNDRLVQAFIQVIEFGHLSRPAILSAEARSTLSPSPLFPLSLQCPTFEDMATALSRLFPKPDPPLLSRQAATCDPVPIPTKLFPRLTLSTLPPLNTNGLPGSESRTGKTPCYILSNLTLNCKRSIPLAKDNVEGPPLCLPPLPTGLLLGLPRQAQPQPCQTGWVRRTYNIFIKNLEATWIQGA